MTGIIPLKKGENITSFFAVNKVRRIIGETKCGHTGTLDPNATGVLPIAVGGATRFIELLPTHKKAYRATFKTGFCTDTLDIWGQVTEAFEKQVSFEEIESVALGFKGEIMQLPPMYSAIKRDGVRLYELARQGIEVERAPRKCEIYELSVGETEDGEYTLYCECSAGTYIRTLINDIGEKLGCGACMNSLSRTEVGVFKREDAIVFDDLNDMTREEILSHLLPVENMFMHLREARMDEFFNRLYFHGEKIKLGKLRGIHGEIGELFRVYDENGFYSLGEICDYDGIKYFRQKKLFR